MNTDQLCEFISKHEGIPRNKVSPTSRMVQDLGIYGDDADELIKAIEIRFGVSYSGVDFSPYFPPEGFNPISDLWDLIRGKKVPLLTVEDLCSLAK